MPSDVASVAESIFKEELRVFFTCPKGTQPLVARNLQDGTVSAH